MQAVIKATLRQSDRQWVDKTLHRWAIRLLNLVHVHCRVVNPHHTAPKPHVPTIIMCNHASLYDIPLSFKAFPRHSLRMLAKKELSKIPIMHGGMRAAEFPFVDRKNRHQAIKDLAAVRQLMESGIVIWIAPEGTRSKDGRLGPFKKGAFVMAIEAQATIIPMGIRGAAQILPARTRHFNLGQKAEIHIGKPISAADYPLENKDALIKTVHDTMKELLGET